MAQNLIDELHYDLNLPIKVCKDTLQLMKPQVNSFLKQYKGDPEIAINNFMKYTKRSFFKYLNQYFKSHKKDDARETKINNYKELYEALALHLIIKLKSPSIMIRTILDKYKQQMKDYCKANKDNINYKKFLSSKIKRTSIMSLIMKAYRENKKLYGINQY